jgi:hypothetical protein
MKKLQLQLAIRTGEAMLGTAAVAWFTLQLVDENPGFGAAAIIVSVGLAGGFSYLMFLAMLSAGLWLRKWSRARLLVLPAALGLGLLGVLLAAAGTVEAAALPAAAPPAQEITETLSIDTYEILLPSGDVAVVEYRITYGEVIVAGALVALIVLQLHTAIVQASRESST